MGFLRELWQGTAPPDTVDYSTLQDLIVADRLQAGSFNKTLALGVAAVFRAREINSAVPARLPVIANGVTLTDTQDRVTEIILSLEDHGDAYLAVDGRDFTVLRFDQVSAHWDESNTVRLYLDRNGRQYRTEGPVPNLVVVSVNRGADDLTGIGWMESGAIQTAIAVNTWVTEFFQGNADPSGTYHLGPAATKDEIAAFRKQIETRNDPKRRSPLYTSGSMTWEPHSFDANSAQWVESHDATTLDVSALSGVPAQFLSVALGGSNLTYTSQSELWALWWQQTAMAYVSRIEVAWSKILGAEVLFDPETLLVASLKQRADSVALLVRSGFEPEPSLDVVGLPEIAHTGKVPVTVYPDAEASNV
jgi:hypothetical protein